MVICVLIGRFFGLLGVAFMLAIFLISSAISHFIYRKDDELDISNPGPFPADECIENALNDDNDSGDVIIVCCPKCNNVMHLHRSYYDKIIKCLNCQTVFKPSEIIDFVKLD